MRARSLAIAVALATVACSSAEREGAFESDDVPRIVLQADEAPDGTRKVAGVGGEQDLDAFARDAAERAALVEDGFVSGYVSYFAPEAYFDPVELVDEDSVSFQVIAGLFEDGEGASTSLHRFMDDLRDRQLERTSEVSVPELGDESYGILGRSASDGSAVLICLWRRRNLILVVSGSGPADEEAMNRAARAMAERAA